MSLLVPPPRLKKPRGRSSAPVSDHGVFRVERLAYPGAGRDFYVLAMPDWCNVIAETEGGEIVLVWQYRHGTDTMTLEIPGGVIDEGEAPEQAARRELREETGYDAPSLELVSVVEPNPALQGNRCFSFLARGARASFDTAFDDHEELEVALVPKSDLPALLDQGAVTHALAIVALEQYLRRFASSTSPR